jgi:hypothetical protein
VQALEHREARRAIAVRQHLGQAAQRARVVLGDLQGALVVAAHVGAGVDAACAVGPLDHLVGAVAGGARGQRRHAFAHTHEVGVVLPPVVRMRAAPIVVEVGAPAGRVGPQDQRRLR